MATTRRKREILSWMDVWRGTSLDLQTTTEATEGYKRVAPGVLKSSACGEDHSSRAIKDVQANNGSSDSDTLAK
jgi:hypothetical protein